MRLTVCMWYNRLHILALKLDRIRDDYTTYTFNEYMKMPLHSLLDLTEYKI